MYYANEHVRDSMLWKLLVPWLHIALLPASVRKQLPIGKIKIFPGSSMVMKGELVGLPEMPYSWSFFFRAFQGMVFAIQWMAPPKCKS